MTTSTPRPRLIVLAGPTGVGKTGLALTLARRFGAEIVNADSVQVYRYLDIGTAKPTAAERAAARHHLLDLVNPDEPFDAAAFVSLARPLIAELDRAGIPVVVAGGTGLYLRSLFRGLFEGPGRDEAFRRRLTVEGQTSGWPALHTRLALVDPVAARRIQPRDRARIVRALEVFELTGRPISEFQAAHALAEAPYDILQFCLDLPRAELYARIERRTREMFAQGLVDEVAGLLARGYGPELKPMKSIGYRQVVDHLAGRLGREAAIEATMTETRRYAKRQLTWYRAVPDVVWISPEETSGVIQRAASFWG